MKNRTIGFKQFLIFFRIITGGKTKTRTGVEPVIVKFAILQHCGALALKKKPCGPLLF
jgi:hypothetical protein